MKTALISALSFAIGLAAVLPAAASTGSAAAIVKVWSDGDLDKRRKPRVPGGSGCDSPGDIREHASCR